MNFFEHLRKHPDLLNQILDSFGEGIAIVDEQEVFRYINPAGSAILGYPHGELIGKSLRELVTEDEFAIVLGLTEERKKGKTSSHDHPVKGKDGSIRYVHVTSTPRHMDGKFAGSYNLFLDITEQVCDKRSVAESEKRFKAVSDVISDFAVSFSFDQSMVVTVDWLSGSISKITGYDEADLKNLEIWRNIGHPEDYVRLKDHVIKKVLTEHEPFSIRTRIITKTGEVKWVEVFANPVFRKKENKLTEIIVAGREITATKKTEDKLRLIEFMTNHAAEWIFLIGAEGQILYVNESACKSLGFSREELLAKNAFDIDPNFRQERLSDLWNRLREQQVMTLESVQRTKNGTEIPTEVTINFLQYGEEEMLVSFVKDITERREEEHLKNISFTIFQSVNKSTGLNKMILEIRNELSKILDTSTLKIFLQNPRNKQTDLFHFNDNKVLVNRTDTHGTLAGWMFQTRKPALLRKEEIIRMKENGRIHSPAGLPACWLGAPLFSGDEILGILSLEHHTEPDRLTDHHLEIMKFVCSQISLSVQRRQSELALKVSEQNLRESNASKDKFFSIIAHDLRGPFNAIIGFSELLHNDFDTFDETEKRTMIRNIHEASVSTFKLLENLLEWSRIQTGRTKPNPENVDLSTIANNSLTFLKHLSEKKNIKLFSGIHFGTIVFCDENMVTTVIRNLISNAIKFTQAGGEVRIWATPREKAVEVVVADNGVGIPPENISKLFKLDESVKTLGTSGERGTGLGLILCREFIELNGGKIWAESKEDRGSQFKFTLPKLNF